MCLETAIFHFLEKCAALIFVPICQTVSFVPPSLIDLELSEAVQACWCSLLPENWPCRLKWSAKSTAIRATQGVAV